jgi:hypothetical protein
MKKAISTKLPTHGRPFEWAIIADEILYTAAASSRRSEDVAEDHFARVTTAVFIFNRCVGTRSNGSRASAVDLVTIMVN